LRIWKDEIFHFNISMPLGVSDGHFPHILTPSILIYSRHLVGTNYGI